MTRSTKGNLKMADLPTVSAALRALHSSDKRDASQFIQGAGARIESLQARIEELEAALRAVYPWLEVSEEGEAATELILKTLGSIEVNFAPLEVKGTET